MYFVFVNHSIIGLNEIIIGYCLDFVHRRTGWTTFTSSCIQNLWSDFLTEFYRERYRDTDLLLFLWIVSSTWRGNRFCLTERGWIFARLATSAKTAKLLNERVNNFDGILKFLIWNVTKREVNEKHWSRRIPMEDWQINGTNKICKKYEIEAANESRRIKRPVNK